MAGRPRTAERNDAQEILSPKVLRRRRSSAQMLQDLMGRPAFTFDAAETSSESSGSDEDGEDVLPFREDNGI